MTHRYALVPAAGGGTRSGSAVPKQYHAIHGQPVLAHTLDRLAGTLALDHVFVAIAPGDEHYAMAIGVRPGVEPLPCGGATRASTVANALAILASRCRADDWILVHDAARPCVPREALFRLVEAVENDAVGGLLAMPVADTLKRGDGDAEPRVARTEAREGLWQAQTPQMFRLGMLRQALEAGGDGITDESSAIEAMGAKPLLVEAGAQNFKVTYPEDFAMAEAVLRGRR